MKKTICTLCVLLLTLALTGCKSNDYKKAQQAYSDGDYVLAMETYKTLGDYKDSQARYQEAQDALWKQMVPGDWRLDAQLDISDTFTEGIEKAINSGDETTKLFAQAMAGKDIRCILAANFHFTESGTYSVDFELLNADEFSNTLMAVLREALKSYLKELVKSEGLTLEDFYTTVGTDDWDKILDTIFGEDLDDLVAELNVDKLLKESIAKESLTGQYQIKDGIIFCDGEDSQFVYNPDTDTITVTPGSDLQELLGKDTATLERT